MKTQEVKLSDGRQYQVTEITWEGWRAVKERMLKMLSTTEVRQAVTSLAKVIRQADASGLKPNTVMDALTESDLPELAAPALRLLNQALDDMTADLIGSCVTSDPPDRLTAMDVNELRAAIFSVNKFAELLSQEKNSLAALVQDFTTAANNLNSSMN